MLSVKLGSIGKAIPNVEVIVADENGKPLPAGHIGELPLEEATLWWAIGKISKQCSGYQKWLFLYR
jgi:acyl-coenzyme A synthetase/AMP-(fatty) acid ligase